MIEKEIIKEITEDEASKLLEEWQERLGLQDWTICLSINCKIDDLELKGAGENEWELVNKVALIKIISKEQYGERIIPFDFEKILVHELLHCKFAILDMIDSSYESRVVDETRHQLVDDLARALIMAKRGTIRRRQEAIKVRSITGGDDKK